MDIVFNDFNNPFYKCRCRLAKLLRECPEGDLAPLFGLMPEDQHTALEEVGGKQCGYN